VGKMALSRKLMEAQEEQYIKRKNNKRMTIMTTK